MDSANAACLALHNPALYRGAAHPFIVVQGGQGPGAPARVLPTWLELRGFQIPAFRGRCAAGACADGSTVLLPPGLPLCPRACQVWEAGSAVSVAGSEAARWAASASALSLPVCDLTILGNGLRVINSANSIFLSP